MCCVPCSHVTFSFLPKLKLLLQQLKLLLLLEKLQFTILLHTNTFNLYFWVFFFHPVCIQYPPFVHKMYENWNHTRYYCRATAINIKLSELQLNIIIIIITKGKARSASHIASLCTSLVAWHTATFTVLCLQTWDLFYFILYEIQTTMKDMHEMNVAVGRYMLWYDMKI